MNQSTKSWGTFHDKIKQLIKQSMQKSTKVNKKVEEKVDRFFFNGNQIDNRQVNQ